MINIEKRSLKLNKKEYMEGAILYWMNRDQRVSDNYALLFAEKLAKEKNVPLLVLYNLVPGFLGGSFRSHVFKIKGLEVVEKNLKEKNISFFLVSGEKTEEDILKFVNKEKIGAVVTDFSPLKISIKWEKFLKQKLEVPFFVVDTHNIVPCWLASQKQEFGAHTLRPKIYKIIPDFLEEIPKLSKQKSYSVKTPQIHWKKIIDDFKDKSIPEASWITPGETHAKKALKKFLDNDLNSYGKNRNDPNEKGQSNLSPYLHYGHISAQRIALEILKKTNKKIESVLNNKKNGAKNETSDEEAFLEELIIRKELSDNFCFYNSQYDDFEGFPDWAKKSLNNRKDDKKEYTYTLKEFENGKTHDELWNACQKEMVVLGKMHGYMRMYWAKKILEWSKSPKEALKIAIYLNDKYELDGRDPNGYAGIAWSIGGVHDRAWFPRKIFGLVRYMARSGCEKKFDVKKYIQYTNSI
jgi:deoxyribodipyrimidine photo-lyase